MDNRAEVRDFLTSRRNRLTPEKAGLAAYGGNRRVTGLRRTEVATLAGVSIEYYTRMERGNLTGVSDTVLDALARALQLDEAERGHLFDLARTASTTATGTSRRSPRSTIRPSVGRILEGMTGVPAYVRNARMDILAANPLCMALYGDILTPQTLPLNVARFMFLDARAHEFFLDWDSIADDLTAALRTESGRSPLDRKLSDLIGELVTRSDEFRIRWARHHVRLHRTTVKRLHNALVGDIELTGDALDLPGDNLTMITYTAEVGSPAQEKLDFLASWTATHPAAPAAIDTSDR